MFSKRKSEPNGNSEEKKHEDEPDSVTTPSTEDAKSVKS